MLQPGEEPCPIDPWIVVPDKSKYVDQQTLKLQENPEVRVHFILSIIETNNNASCNFRKIISEVLF